MENIGLIGGTFDPIHFGHLILADQARTEAGLDCVIFMPAKTSPYKVSRKCVSEKQRYKMVSIAIEDNPDFEVSDLELKGEDISYTYETLMKLQAQLGPGKQIHFICGTDAFIGMGGWKNREKLLAGFPIIVGSRPRYRDRARDDMIEIFSKEYGARIQRIHMPKIDISSTDIKSRLLANRSIRYMVPQPVLKYIQSQDLYRNL